MDIGGRKSRILQEIVMRYTMYGDPVGSKLLNELLEEISVSSATIRSEMAELTSLGLLEQPYTSAGRVPTLMGYRYYVENLLRPAPLTAVEKRHIEEAAGGLDSDPDRAAGQAAHLLAKLTDLAAMVTTPRGGDIKITRFELVRSGRYSLAVLGITSIGGVINWVCRVAGELSSRRLAAVTSAINEHLVYVSPEDITPRLLGTIRARLADDAVLCAPIVAAAVDIIRGASEVRVYADGQQHLLSYQELDSHLKDLLNLFSDSDAMSRCLDTDNPLSILVGEAFGIENLGMVMGRYRAAGGRKGVLAVAGPVRMNYSFVIPRLSYFRDRMSAALTNPDN